MVKEEHGSVDNKKFHNLTVEKKKLIMQSILYTYHIHEILCKSHRSSTDVKFSTVTYVFDGTSNHI